MERVRIGTHRRARGDQRDRGGDRRRERDRDADRGGGALRPLPAPPAARPGGPRRARLALHPVRRSRTRSSRGGASRRSRPSATASSSPRSTWRCAARGRSSEPASTACRGSGWRSFPRTSAMLIEARREVIALLDRHGSLDAPELGPLLDAARQRFGDERAEPIRLARSLDEGRRRRAKGRRLRRPPRRSAAVRPTADRVREALFSILGRRWGRQRPRPLLRHRGARHRGRLAGGRPGDAGRHARRRWRAATSRELGLATAARWSAPTRCAICGARGGAST